jgi:hypothetical protein
MLPRLRLPLRVKDPPLAIGHPVALRPPCFELEFFPAASIRPLTRGNAQRCENSSLEGTMRRRSWPSPRILLPLSDCARLWSIGPSFAPPMEPSSDREPAGPILDTTPRPTLTQIQSLRRRRGGRDREFRRLLFAGHGGPWQSPCRQDRPRAGRGPAKAHGFVSRQSSHRNGIQAKGRLHGLRVPRAGRLTRYSSGRVRFGGRRDAVSWRQESRDRAESRTSPRAATRGSTGTS